MMRLLSRSGDGSGMSAIQSGEVGTATGDTLLGREIWPTLDGSRSEGGMRNRFAGEGKPRAYGLIFVLCLAAIPFWAAVAYLDPLAALRPAPRRTGLGTMVEVVPPGLTPMRCQHLEQ